MPRYIDADALLERLTKKKSEVAKARYTEGFNDALMKTALDLINRLKVENERFQMGEYRHIGKTVKNARREGIEDVFDRLRNIICLHTEGHISLGLKDIDLIESEMVGEDNAT